MIRDDEQCSEFAKIYTSEETFDFGEFVTKRSNCFSILRLDNKSFYSSIKDKDSAVIYFKERPIGEQINIIKRRAKKFVSICYNKEWTNLMSYLNYNSDLKIIQYRLIHIVKEEEII